MITSDINELQLNENMGLNFAGWVLEAILVHVLLRLKLPTLNHII